MKYSFVSAGFAGLQPEILWRLWAIQGIYRAMLGRPSYFIVITGAQEWSGHCLFSLHHTGYAVDIQTKNLPDSGVGRFTESLATAVRRLLGPDYVVLSREPGHAPHLHVQYQRGRRVAPPGDYTPAPDVA